MLVQTLDLVSNKCTLKGEKVQKCIRKMMIVLTSVILGDKARVSWPQNSSYGSVGESRNSKIDEHRNVDLLLKTKLSLTVKT